MNKKYFLNILAGFMVMVMTAVNILTMSVAAVDADPEIPSGMAKIIQYGFHAGEDISGLVWAQGDVYDAGNTSLAEDGSKSVLKAEKTSSVKESRLYQILSESYTGTVIVETSVKNTDGVAGDFLQIRDSDCNTVALLRFTEDGKLVCILADRAGNAKTLELAAGYTKSQWYDVKLVTNTASRRVEVFLDGELAGSGYFAENAKNIAKYMLAAVVENQTGIYMFDYLNIYKIPDPDVEKIVDLDFDKETDIANIAWADGDGGTNTFQVDTENSWLKIESPINGTEKKQLRYTFSTPITEGIWNLEFRTRADEGSVADVMHVREAGFGKSAVTCWFTNINSFLYKARKLLTNGVENINFADPYDGSWVDVKMVMDMETKQIQVYCNGIYTETVYFREDADNIGTILLALFSPSAEQKQAVYYDYIKMYRVSSQNHAPVIDRVGVKGTPRAGRILLADYDYHDPEGDAVFPQCQWYYSATADGTYYPISGETGKSLVCPWPCAGLFYKVELALKDDTGAISQKVFSQPIQDTTLMREIKNYDFSNMTMEDFKKDWAVPESTTNGTTKIENGNLVITANNQGGYALTSSFDINAEMAVIEFDYSKDDVPDTGYNMNTIDVNGYDGAKSVGLAYTRATGKAYNAGYGNLANGQETDALVNPMATETPYRTRVVIDTKNKGNGEAAFFLNGEWKTLKTNKGEKKQPTLRNKAQYISGLIHQFAKGQNGNNYFSNYSIRQIIVPAKVAISGTDTINNAGTTDYTASVVDIYGKDQTVYTPVEWSVSEANGISVDPETGKLTVGKNAKNGIVKVRAAVKGDNSIYTEFPVTIAIPALESNWFFTQPNSEIPSEIAVAGGKARLTLQNSGYEFPVESAILILAVYDGNTLVSTELHNVSIAALLTEQQFDIIVPSETEVPEVKAFLWDGESTMKPLWKAFK